MKKLMDYFEKNKTKIIIFVICAASLALIGTGTAYLVNEAKVNREIAEIFENGGGSGKIIVHVKGAVANAGVYELFAGARVCDAIDAAGGFSEEADREAQNLAAVLEDGQQVFVPAKDDSGEKNGLVNINKATLHELMSLPGIGEAHARKIIEYREKHGSFNSVSEIKDVEGIGSKKYEAIKDLITI